MNINTQNLVSITDANQNFSKVARMVDEQGPIIIMKNNAPKYLLIQFNEAEQMTNAPTEDVLSLSKRIMEKNQVAYKVLAK
ncbi:MAG TPA: type II toxin-antitoxin system prevent-host-death family antitoxin [Dialister sp.]|nr:type II toxin-antitoxin system prevent-host-death family antitoxin [Dialister sp.]